MRRTTAPVLGVPRPVAEYPVRGLAVTYPTGTDVLPTEAGWDHLVYACAGVMTAETDLGTWVIPPHRALWAPDGVAVRIVRHGRVSVRSLYLHRSLAVLPATVQVLDVPPLLRELVLHAVRRAPLDLDVGEHRRLVEVLADQLRVLPQAPLQLVLPTDPRALVMARHLAAGDAIDAAARAAGASRRTLERLFVAETGMSLGAWRRRHRFIEALRLLAEGQSVTAVANRIGYSTPSAFGFAFHRELGETPGRYFQTPGRDSEYARPGPSRPPGT
jgi:AraC-like DNA-binding protein